MVSGSSATALVLNWLLSKLMDRAPFSPEENRPSQETAIADDSISKAMVSTDFLIRLFFRKFMVCGGNGGKESGNVQVRGGKRFPSE